MKLLSLRLRGAIGIREGLGLEEVSVDFTKFSAGLIVVLGETGSGKTTFMENLAPFGKLRSHKGGLSRQFYLKDSCRDLRLALGDDQYQFLIEMNPTLKRPLTKSYVYKNGECLNPDGNAKGYDEIVGKLFGNEELFFLSAFMSQKRLPFSRQEIADRKDLLLDLIGAQRHQLKYEFANQSAKDVRDAVAKIQAEIDAQTKSNRPVTEIRADIELIQKSLEAYSQNLMDSAFTLAQHKHDLEQLQIRHTEQAVKESRLSRAKSRVTELTADFRTVEASRDVKVRDLQAIIGRCECNIIVLEPLCTPEAEVSLDAHIVAADEIKTAYLASVEMRQQYNVQASEYAEASHSLDVKKREHESARVQLETGVTSSQQVFDSAKQTVNFKRSTITSNITTKTRATEILTTVPCQDDSITADCRDTCKSCQFLKDATAAVQEIGTLTTQLAELDRQWSAQSVELQSAIDTAKANLAAHPALDTVLAPLQARVDKAIADGKALNFDRVAADTLKAKYEANERADYAGQKNRLAEKKAALAAAREGLQHRQAMLVETRSGFDAKITELQAALDTAREEVAEIEPQIDVTIELRIRDLRDKLAAVESERQSAQEAVVRYETNIARLNEDLLKSGQLGEKIEDNHKILSALQSDLADWEHLAQSLSRNGGFQSMLVESAGAEMSPFANELLSLYGRPWTIELATAKVTTDGQSFKDGLFVTVNRPQGDCELADLSGGEESIIDQVLYDSIANLLRRRSGKTLQTAIRDEVDMALDEEHALDCIKSIEIAHGLSGMHHTFLVSHRQSIQESIPNRLRFIKGKGIEVEAA